MEVFDQQKGRFAAVQIPQPLEHRHRLTASQSFDVQNPLKAVDEIPATKLVLQPGRCLPQ